MKEYVYLCYLLTAYFNHPGGADEDVVLHVHKEKHMSRKLGSNATSRHYSRATMQQRVRIQMHQVTAERVK